MITSEPDMKTLAADSVDALDVQFHDHWMTVALGDTRRISIDMERVDWLRWLLDATPQQREQWSIEPGGYAIYWDELDDGVEIEHLLSLHPINHPASALRLY